jgi:hypothetical protein
VKDTIKRLIVPEINAAKEKQELDKSHRALEETRRGPVPHSDLDNGSLLGSAEVSEAFQCNMSMLKLNYSSCAGGVVLGSGGQGLC